MKPYQFNRFIGCLFLLFFIVVLGCAAQNETPPEETEQELQMKQMMRDLSELNQTNQEYLKSNKELQNKIDNLETAFEKNDTSFQQKMFQLNTMIEEMQSQMQDTKEASVMKTPADQAGQSLILEDETLSIATTPKPSSNSALIKTDDQSQGQSDEQFDEQSNEQSNLLIDDSNAKDLSFASTPTARNTTTSDAVDLTDYDQYDEEESGQIFFDPALSEPEFPFILKHQVNARKEYIESYRVYTLKNYDGAIKKFNSFLQKFPNDSYSDNAQYWIAMSHFKLKQYQLAQKRFRDVLKNYEHGATVMGFKTPDAILGLAIINLELNKNKEAKYYFSHVLERYPDSGAAKSALNHLNTLRNSQ